MKSSSLRHPQLIPKLCPYQVSDQMEQSVVSGCFVADWCWAGLGGSWWWSDVSIVQYSTVQYWGGIMVMEWWTPYTLCSELRPARHGCHSARAVNGTPRNFTVRGEGPIYELLKLLSIAFNIDNLLRHYDKAVFKHSTARSAEVEPPRTWLKVW